ncbi:hypothetical protein [Sneathiella sp.]|uniref:hypothetical protein n=1 Tax=Sneathiella sp. TaxID=1964365 RepID=UPI00262DEE70|nr:hypothetical protein [Sneathiella sp.]MDF2367862.1 hypothetical protein [Sneathiella sp.]
MSTDTNNYSQFVVQTLFDTKWRSFGRYEAEKPAQDIARQLIAEWGGQRVRILGGYFSREKDRNIYHCIEVAERVRFRDTRAYKNSKFAVGSMALGGAMLAIFLFAYSIVAPMSSMADDGKGPELAEINRPTPIAPIVKPVNLRARFTEVIKVPYDKVWNFDSVPLRLRGPWSTACNTDGDKVVLGERDLSHSVEGDPSPLTSVWQTGQRYGLVLKSGSVDMVAMISADRLQKIGTMNRLGEFTADTTGAILNRCL